MGKQKKSFRSKVVDLPFPTILITAVFTMIGMAFFVEWLGWMFLV